MQVTGTGAMASGHSVSNSSGTPQPRPAHERHLPIAFEGPDGHREVAYPINYEEVYTLKGRLLTLIDATFTDPEQRKAQKDVVWQTLRSWMDSIVGEWESHIEWSPSDAGEESSG